jgi:hypothetical protein
MVGDGFGVHDDAFGEAGVPGDVLFEAHLHRWSILLFARGMIRFCPFAYILLFTAPPYLSEYYGLAREHLGKLC